MVGGANGMLRMPGRILALVIAAFAVWPFMLGTADAKEDLLVASDPYRHQELSEPPSGVVLAFSRAVDAAAAQIVVTNSAGKSVNINSLIVEGTNVTAQVRPNLPKGTYTVHYQVNRADGEVEGGAYQFAYGPGHWTELPDESWSGNTAQPTVIASPEPAPTVPSATGTTPTPSDTPSAAPTTATPPGPSATPAAGGGAADPAPWLWGGAAVVLLAAGGGAVAWRRSAGKRRAG